MNQEQLKEQFIEFAENNLNNKTMLKAIAILLENISNDMYTDGYIKESNTLTTCLISINEILKQEQ